MTQRFTTDGSAALEQRLTDWCAGFTDDIRRAIPATHLEAVVLGGGYGRGEGGVLCTTAGDQPYNDLEFYIFVRGPLLVRERQYRRRISEIAHAWTEKTGLEFEAKILTFPKIQRSPVSMFYHDLVVGHRWLYGAAQEFADCEHHRAAHRIPLHEATRLLMNRCSGLLFSASLLQKEHFLAADADFVRRNISKAQLALGDVILTAFGRYHTSCRERRRRLEKLEAIASLPSLEKIISHHQIGVLFKLHPFQSDEPAKLLAEEHAEVKILAGQIFLWLERRRLDLNVSTLTEYALHKARKQPETKPVRNLLINLRTFGPTVFSTRYPRERLLESLPLLLWNRETLCNANVARKLKSDLKARDTSFPTLVDAYQKLWSRFN